MYSRESHSSEANDPQSSWVEKYFTNFVKPLNPSWSDFLQAYKILKAGLLWSHTLAYPRDLRAELKLKTGETDVGSQPGKAGCGQL